MWILEPFVSSSQIATNATGSNLQIVYMIPNRSYIVGRKRDECEVFVDNDKSISRKHAVISVDDLTIKQALIEGSSDLIIKPKLSVEDFSKYGTFVVKGSGSPDKLNTNTKTDLDANWRIRFGVYQSIYVIKHELMIFCVSRLNDKDRKKLANQCKTIDAKYSKTLDRHCTHLVVDDKDCIITEKIVLALLMGIPIVTMEYVNELEKCLTSTARQTVILPRIEDYYASSVNFNWNAYGLTSPPDFKPNPDRKSLFSNKQFITMNVDICVKLMPLIESASGTIENHSEIDENFVKSCIGVSDCIFIENMIEPEMLEKLNYYGFQLFDEKTIMAAILLCDATNIKTVQFPRIPEPVKPSTINVMSDEDKTDDELEVPPQNNIIDFEMTEEKKSEVQTVQEVEESFEPPLKKTKANEETELERPKVKEEPKKGRGIEIPLSLAEDHEMEEPKKITPKKEIKMEKKEIKRERISKPVDPDEPIITVEYIDLIKVKDEKPSQTPNYSQTGYNAKRFRKVKYDGSTISKGSTVNLVSNSSMVEDSVNFDAELSTPTKPKEIKLVAKTEIAQPTLEKKETKKTVQKKETPPKNAKKESTILDAIGLDDDEDDDDDEPTLLGVRKRK